MTSSVLSPLSSNVTVVTCPLSPASSLVQTRREGGTTSRYLPWNAIGSGASGWRNTRRYTPPTRTSSSQESSVRPNDFGTHQRWNSSALVHASNTMRGRALTVRVTTSSRSDFRYLAIRVDSADRFAGTFSATVMTSILIGCRSIELHLHRSASQA